MCPCTSSALKRNPQHVFFSLLRSAENLAALDSRNLPASGITWLQQPTKHRSCEEPHGNLILCCTQQRKPITQAKPAADYQVAKKTSPACNRTGQSSKSWPTCKTTKLPPSHWPPKAQPSSINLLPLFKTLAGRFATVPLQLSL